MKSYDLHPTSNPDLFRVVDRNGNWQFYRFKPQGKRGRYLRGITSVLDIGLTKGERFERWLENNTAEAINRKLRLACDQGDAVHQGIALALSGATVHRGTEILAENNRDMRTFTDAEWLCMLAFERFWTSHKCALVAHEAAVINLRLGIAGTFDKILVMRATCGDKRAQCQCAPFVDLAGLGDWKTGGGIYESHGAQVAALASCDLSQFIGKRPIGYTLIVRLGTDHKRGYQVEFYDRRETAANLKQFKAALTIATPRMPLLDRSDFKEFPDSLSLVVERTTYPEPTTTEVAA